MTGFANGAYFNASSLQQASKGIVNPQDRPLEPGTILYRFGSSLQNAQAGGWWLDANQYSRVENWAALHSLSVPHAARVLCAVAHAWGAGSPARANMLVLVRAVVLQRLIGHEGPSRDQVETDANGLVREIFSPQQAAPESRIVQLYIPGIEQVNQTGSVLSFGAPVIYSVGESHIGGVPGIPAGATLQ